MQEIGVIVSSHENGRWTINDYNLKDYTSKKPYNQKIIFGLMGTDFTRFLVTDQLEQKQVCCSNFLLSVRCRLSSPRNRALSTGAARHHSYSLKPRHKAEPSFS